MRHMNHHLCGRVVRIRTGPLSGLDGVVIWFEAPNRIAVDLGCGIAAMLLVSDVKLQQDKTADALEPSA